MISDVRQRMYAFIKEYIEQNKRPPTYREIQEKMLFNNIRSVEHHLHRLQDEGLILIRSKSARCIELVDQAKGVPVKGTIAAGQLLHISPGPFEEWIDIEVVQSGSFYALLVRGDSMIGDHIHDGDYVLIKEQSDCLDGDIIVAVHKEGDSEASATLKRFKRDAKRGMVCLQPSNPKFPLIEIDQRAWRQQWVIQGKVIAIFRRIGEIPKRNFDL